MGATNLIVLAIVTAYCPCKKCTGSGEGITASQTYAFQGRTIAAPRAIPFGTPLFIEGIGWRYVEDRAKKKYDHRIDLFFKSHREAKRFGIQYRKIFCPTHEIALHICKGLSREKLLFPK